MPYASNFTLPEPERAALETQHGLLLLEFGVSWCPHCQRAQQPLQTVLAEHAEVSHLKIEDGQGRPLGRSFRVKLWPTLIMMKDGVETARVVRPTTATEIAALLEHS